MFEINGIVWGIAIVSSNHPQLTQPNGRQAIGCCNSSNRMIYISAAIAYSPLLREVLAHEVTHAAIFSYGIELPLDQEEFVASFIAVYGDEIFRIVDRFI